MHAISAPRRHGQGFTLVEIMIGLVILSLLLAIGVPSMRSWLTASSAQAATEFYADGFKQARAEAVKRNAVTRLTLTSNTTNGQYDWQVDLCIPLSVVADCDDNSGVWSTTTTPVLDFLSIKRIANNMPLSSQMALTRSPAGAVAVYFTPLGWVNGAVAPSLNKIQLAPAPGNEGAFPKSAVAMTLAGVISKCSPDFALPDSRSCPP